MVNVSLDPFCAFYEIIQIIERVKSAEIKKFANFNQSKFANCNQSEFVNCNQSKTEWKKYNEMSQITKSVEAPNSNIVGDDILDGQRLFHS